MDGFVLHAADTETATVQHPLTFTVLGTIYAGDTPMQYYGHDYQRDAAADRGLRVCYEIMIGAMSGVF